MVIKCCLLESRYVTKKDRDLNNGNYNFRCLQSHLKINVFSPQAFLLAYFIKDSLISLTLTHINMLINTEQPLCKCH